jgi:hypothetical protein
MISFKTSLQRVSLKTRDIKQNKLLIYLKAFRYFIWSNFVCLFGEIQIYPKAPPFVIIGKIQYKVNCDQIREMLKLIHPGDILIRRFESYISGKMIPGHYTHVALYCGDLDSLRPDRVIHAIGEGVVEEDFLKFCRTDEIVIVRPEKTRDEIKMAIQKAISHKDAPYDYDFNFSNDLRFSCTELVYDCYDQNLPIIVKKVIYPDAFLKAGKIIYKTAV